VYHDHIRRRVAGTGQAEVDGDVDEIRPAQVVDREQVSAASQVDVRGFHAVQVHDDGRDVARQSHATGVGDDVARVAGIPLEVVVAVAQQRAVRALVAVDEVLTGAAVEEVVAVAAEQRVGAGVAVHRQLGQRGQVADSADRVRAVESGDDQALGEYVQPRGAGRGDARLEAVGDDRDLVVTGRAVVVHGVE